MESFEKVTAVKKANIYFDGKVTSRTILFADGTRKTLGIMMPGEYEFGTAAAEIMEVLQGSLTAMLPGETEWKTYGEGESFQIPADSKFKVIAEQVADYCCSYV